MAFYSMSARFNSLFFTASIFMVIACILNQLTAYLFVNPQPKVNLEVAEVTRLMQNRSFKWDECHMKLKLDAQLSSYQSWNLKQLFFYIEIEWENSITKKIQQNTVYDQIIQYNGNTQDWKKVSDFSLKNLRLEYVLRDVHYQLQGKIITINSWVEIMPVVGIIRREKIDSFQYQLPESYKVRK